MTTLTVGSGQDYTTLSAAVAAAKPGDTIDLQPGTYTNDFPGLINGLTIEGVGGIAKLVATTQPGNGKAILDVAGNTTLRNLDISGVTVPDANGAAIRYESGNLTIVNTAIHGNQDGILGASDPNGSITIDQSEIYANGTGTGNTHNIYIGDIAQFTLTNSYIHDANTGHEIKSRAENNTITNNRIEDNGSTASYEIDLPNGGNATISGNTIQKSANSGNHVTIAYGEEYVPNSTVPEQKLNAGTTVSVSNNTFVSDQSGAYVIWDTTNAPVTASGNTTYNYNQIYKASQVSSSGFTATSARPTIDTSSPINQSPGATTPTPAPTPTPPADTTAPSLTVTETASGLTKAATDTISGTVSDSGSGVAKVEIYDTIGGKTVDLGSAAISNGSFSFTSARLADGSHAFSAIATDKSGNATAAMSAGAPLVVDTTAPTLTVGETVSGTTTKTSNILSGTVSDTGSGVAAVEIFVNSAGTSTDLGSATLNGSSWTYTVGNLTPGTYDFFAVGSDKAGNTTAMTSIGAAQTVVSPTPASTRPTIASITSANNTFVIKGTAQAKTTIILTDTPAGGQPKAAGFAVAGSDGSWTISTQTLSAGKVNTLSASTTPGGGTAGAFIVASTAADTLRGTAGQSDVFAFPHVYGKDIIQGFETTAAVGSTHDVINLSGTGYTSFSQLKPLISGTDAAVIRFNGTTSITLAGVGAHSLQASDFRFS